MVRDCCIEQSFKTKNELIMISVDVKTVDRGKLLDVLIKYNIHPKMISRPTLAKIYF